MEEIIMKYLLFTLMAIFSLYVWAYVPPSENVEKSLEKGVLSFSAIAQKTEIERINQFSIDGIIYLSTTQCFVGKECEEGKYISLPYKVKSLKEWEFGVNFPIGKEIIFVLSHTLESKNIFSSNLHTGIDRAFVCDGFPHRVKNNSEDTLCKSIYRVGKPIYTSLEKLRAISDRIQSINHNY